LNEKKRGESSAASEYFSAIHGFTQTAKKDWPKRMAKTI
jgi:hypothetical protein